MEEESLGNVLGIGIGMSLPPDVGIDGIPVGAAQPVQRFRRRGGTLTTRGHDVRPMRDRKPLRLLAFVCRFVCRHELITRASPANQEPTLRKRGSNSTTRTSYFERR